MRVELLTVLGVYGLYEAVRGLFTTNDAAIAVHHADDVAAAERWLHLFAERHIQEVAEQIGGLVSVLSVAYLTLHIALTGAFLLWLYRRRPQTYPFVRTTLLVTSTLALVGYIVFPTAPPRLSALGILDTVSRSGHVGLNHGLVSSLYNPYAAMPSMHAGYAAIVGATVFRETRPLLIRVVGLAYPFFVAFVIVTTGNHFFLDAVAGVAVAGVAAAITKLFNGPACHLQRARQAHARQAMTVRA